MKRGTIFAILALLIAFPVFPQNITYEYDALNRLKKVNYGNGKVIIYDYDEVGNRTAHIITTGSSTEPLLSVSPTTLDFGSSQSQMSFNISNAGGGTLNWNIAESTEWITSVAPVSGTNAATVVVTVSRNGLGPGPHEANILVTSNGGNQNVLIKLSLSSGGLPSIRTPIDPIVFGTVDVGGSAEKSTTIYNDGAGVLVISSVEKTTGSDDYTVISTFPMNIGPHSSGQITLRFHPSSHGPQTVTYRLNHNDPNQPNTQVNAAGQGSYQQPPSFPLTVEAETMQGVGLQVPGGRKLTTPDSPQQWYIIQQITFPRGGWLKIEVIAKTEGSVNGQWPRLQTNLGSGTPVQEINSTEFQSYVYERNLSQGGSFTYEIRLNEITRQTPGHAVIVDKTIISYFEQQPALSVKPTLLDFGDTATQLNFSITNAGDGNLQWTISESTSWISSVSPSSGTGNGTITVKVDRSSLPVDNHQATILISSNGGNLEVTARLNITQAAPTIASFAPTSGPVGTQVTITGNNFTGATQVAFNGVAASTFTTDSNNQIRAVVPAGATTGKISVTTPFGTASSAENYSASGNGGNIVFEDDFNRAEIGPNWQVSGAFGIINDELAFSAGTALAVNAGNLSNSSVEFDWRATRNLGTRVTSIYLRYTDASHCVVLRIWREGHIDVEKHCDGTTIRLIDYYNEIAPGRYHFGVNQDKVYFYNINGSGTPVYLSGSDASLPLFNAGFVGLGANGEDAYIDNLVIRDLGPAQPPSRNLEPEGGIVAFSDDFNRADIGPKWQVAGSFGINNGELAFSTGTALATDAGNLLNSSIEFDWRATRNTGNRVTAIYLRYKDASNYVVLRIWREGHIDVERHSNGTTSRIIDYYGVIGSGRYHFGINQNKVYFYDLNSTCTPIYLTGTEDSLLSLGAGLVGLGANEEEAYVDNLVIRDLGLPPVLLAFTPASGPVGASITITGNNFNGATQVAFNGVAASTFTVDLNTRIRAVVPAGASTGKISVTTPGGTDTSSNNFIVLPTKAWVTSYNGSGNNSDEAKAVAVDGAGNVYVTGSSIRSNGNRDYVTIKYNNVGVQQWAKRYNGPGNGEDTAHALAIDAAGNVYITGSSANSSGNQDYATIKYSSAGTPVWVKRYNGPSNKSDIAYVLAIDGGGNVYVAGASTAANDYSDYATAKYSSEGNQLWVKSFNGSGNNNDAAKAIAVDGAGNIYVTGSSVGSTGLRDYVTVKYNSTGAQQWSRRYNGAGNHHGEANALVVDGNGNVYATGSSAGSNGNQDYTTIKYNSAGTQQWVKRYNGLGNNNDIANALAVDGSGNVYVTGSSTVANGFYDYVTVKYNNMGVQQWVRRYNGSGNHNDEAKAIAIYGTGNVYVTGSSVGSNEFQDYVTVKYNSAGAQQWAIRYYGLANKNDIANAIAVDGVGNVYVTGASAAVNEYYNYATIKYLATDASSAFAEEMSSDNMEFNDRDGDALAKMDENTTLPTAYNLEQNFPNPFNPITTIRFATPTTGKVKLVVFNVRGELVRTLVDGEAAAGYHNITFDASDLASGIYFYRLEAGAFTATQKMALTK